ncbi:MAG: TolC family protein [Mucinivorans sp.]
MKRFFAIALSLVPLVAWTQQSPKWDIEQCINYAIDNNIQVKQAVVSQQISELSVQQSKFDYIPTLGGQMGYNANFGRALDPTTYEYTSGKTVNNVNAGVSLSTTLFAGMQKMHRLERAKLNLLSSIQDAERIKNDITINITASYLQALYNKEQIKTCLSQIELLQEQLSRTKQLVDAGSMALGALLELEAQKASESYNLVNYRNQLSTSLLSLKQLLELRGVPDFDIVEPQMGHLGFQDMAISDVEWVYEQGQSLPQIQYAKLRQEVAQADLSIAKASMYPTLTASANYGSSFSDARQKPIMGPDGKTSYINYPFFGQLGDNASAAIGVQLNIPMFNGLTAQRNIRVAKLNRLNAELGVTLAQDKLYQDVQKAYTDATGARERFVSASSSVSSAELSFQYAEQKFSAGATTSVEYNQAKNNLIAAQSMKIQAKYEYVFKIKLLDFYAGRHITL